MTKALDDRLAETEEALKVLESAVSSSGERLSPEVQTSLQTLFSFQIEIPDLRESIGARASAFSLLEGLEARVNPSGAVLLLQDRPVKFHQARLIGVQAYLAIQWSIADRITDFVGRVVLPKPSIDKPPPPTQLLSHFVGGSADKTMAAGLLESTRKTFGWPLALSYELRNHFVHHGGQTSGVDIFESKHASAGFRVSDDGWDRFMTRIGRHQVGPTMNRRLPGWPSSRRQDLRWLLQDCEAEVDQALGTLLRSSLYLLVANVQCLIGSG